MNRGFPAFIVLMMCVACVSDAAAASTPTPPPTPAHAPAPPSDSDEPPAPPALTDVAALALPVNLRVPAGLRPLLERVRHRSPTFRRQLDLIARTRNVRIDVSYGGLRGDRLYHALSTVRKHEWGAILVHTELFVPSDLVEIVAHEMEHVCEQIEGVDLRGLATRRHAGVIYLNGHYETTRAIHAGQRVTREYQGIPADAPLARVAY